ncbi:hypothetical protein AGOR_G00000070 [Albula goreensis]|uniref:Link domain-containing protein n=1 Tax=Albula goreensis TaxID=1534307 RepID=A0A8T3E5B9_9TELE|nr:hypothetical protein AGOR_G00000070 [Albula goreensis]
MAVLWLLFCHLLSLVVSSLAVDPSQIKAYPESGSISGVFLASFQPAASKNPVYGFNASQAPQACELMNVVIATKNQVEEAHRNGFETCRYGWIAEKIAVLPRIIKSKKCGQDRVGVITWNSIPTRLFDAFCFNVSDVQTDVQVATTSVPTATPGVPKNTPGAPSSPPPLPHPTHTAPPPTPASTSPPPSRSTTSSPPLPMSSPSVPSASPSISRSTPPPFPPTRPAALPTSARPSPALSDPDSLDPQGHSGISSLGVVPTALLILSLVVLLLAVFSVLGYYRLNRRRNVPFWKRGRQKEDIETEVWENIYQEPKEQQNETEMDGCQNNSSNITLSATKTDSS